MPIRDYQCEGCNHEFENLDRTPAKLRKCPSCGKNKLVVIHKQMAAYHNLRSPAHPDRLKGKVRR